MTKIYFVRHAEPEHSWKDDRTRPLTKEGIEDTKYVLDFLKDKKVDKFYCSPYIRSMDTIRSTAELYEKAIVTDERLREREKGKNGNCSGMIEKRWNDLSYHEEGGESIQMVQDRNIEALQEILRENVDATLVIGTHGTALSSILRYYDGSYNCQSFLRIIDWMPYIIELDFEDNVLIDKTEHIHVYKKFSGKSRADQKDNSSILG